MIWRRSLLPLSGVYGAALAVKNLAYARGWSAQQRLAWPVVSIGNISVGGTGKTPFTAELARLLNEQGLHVDVLSRGYGRRSEAAVERVSAESGDAARYGDEPVLLAQDTGVPVYVGASRYAAGMMAERETAAPVLRNTRQDWPSAVHLLDDGFQHRQLARDVDMVLLHARDVGDALLPAGRLREGIPALHRADFIVLREEDAASAEALRRAGIDGPVWRVRRVVQVPQVAGSVVAFAGIARPEGFFASLRAAGLDVRQTFGFRDHHRFTPAELRSLAQAAAGAAAIVTTEKDLVRLRGDERTVLGRGCGVVAAPLRVELIDATESMEALRRLLAERAAARCAVRE